MNLASAGPACPACCHDAHLIGTARPPAASIHLTYAAATYDLPGHLWHACTAVALQSRRGGCILLQLMRLKGAARPCNEEQYSAV